MQNNAEAQRILGLRYADNRGVARDDDEAVAWLYKASEQGDAEAKLATEQKANQQLQARLEEFQLDDSSANVNDRVRMFVAHSFYEDEIMSYLHGRVSR